MTSTPCPNEDVLEQLIQLPDSDPQRAHVDACPRCRSLALEYRAFLAPAGNAPFGAGEARALDAQRAGLEASRARASTPRTTSGWAHWFRPALRPAWGFGALALIAAVVLVAPQFGPRPTPGRVRGVARTALALDAPEYRADGSVQLRWRGFPGAERYEVRFYSAALVDLGSAAGGADTVLTLGPDQLPASYPAGEPVLYRIEALEGRDRVAASSTGTLRTPIRTPIRTP